MQEPNRTVARDVLNTEVELGKHWLARFAAVHPDWVSRVHDPRFGPVFTRGQGARLWDVDGLDYIDLTCGYSACNFGHAFAPLVAAATSQLTELTHVTGDPHVGRILLAERLAALLGPLTTAAEAPGGHAQVVFNVSGARAVETAWKAARAHRPGQLLTLGPSFHGRSIGTLGISAGIAPAGGGFLQPELAHVWPVKQYPYCARCPVGLTYPGCGLRCVENLWRFIRERADGLSAVLVEPAIGARGYIFPPAEFFQRLRAVTNEMGVLLIADEIQTGLGRCGGWLLSERQGWQADLVLLGKSLGGGIAPISAVVGRADVLGQVAPGTESETFSGSPLASAIALEVLHQLESKAWMQRGEQIGRDLRQGLADELQRMGLDAWAVEGLGACAAVEFSAVALSADMQGFEGGQGIEDIQGIESGQGRDRALRFATACKHRRVLVHASGPHSSRVVLLPPLTLGPEEQADALGRLALALREMADGA